MGHVSVRRPAGKKAAIRPRIRPFPDNPRRSPWLAISAS